MPSLDKIFAALGHPVRLVIIERLMQQEATVSEIAAPFQLSLNAISKHLKVLEAAGLIERRVSGREHFCRLAPGSLDAVHGWVRYHPPQQAASPHPRPGRPHALDEQQ